MTVANEQGFALWVAFGSILRGRCLAMLDPPPRESQLLKHGTANYRQVRCGAGMPFWLAIHAEAPSHPGQPEEGLKHPAEAAKLLEATQERLPGAEVQRQRGELLLSMHNSAAAEDSFCEVLAAARRQGATFWHLRAATSLARLRGDPGKRTEARDLLTPVYNSFTEGSELGEAQDVAQRTLNMNDVQNWLEGIGLGQYAEAFEANDLDMDLLAEVDDQVLKDIGISSAGHRLRIRKAIAKLLSAPIPQDKAQISHPPETTPAGAERRQLTVMFCDLVGSTELSSRLDPEDMRSIIGAYHGCCAEQVQLNGGFVAKYMGDGVLVYFGYPQAHEDDAERAVRTGLALVAAVPKLSTAAGATLQVRVGIATGLVVVGDLIGSGEAQERGIVGETPNLAARLQAAAEPNMVVMADSTRKLIGDLFVLEDLGTKDLKGIAAPVGAWAALRASSMESRFEALHATGLTALVGREEETELLLRRWSKVQAGEGQVVLLSGEAGIGKSRLTAVLLQKLAREPHARLRYFCSPRHTNSPFHPIIGQMERAAGMAHDDTQQSKLDKLDAVLANTSCSKEDAALLAELLSLPNDGRHPLLELQPEQRRQRMLDALIGRMEALTRQNPVLMILEDAQWTDPTSLEVFGRVVNIVQKLRVLLIVTFRPEFNTAMDRAASRHVPHHRSASGA